MEATPVAQRPKWVRTYEHGTDYMESLDGIMWADAPLPYPWHRCTTQTRGWFGLNYTERCACGATRFSTSDRWMSKNETRQGRARKRREDRKPRVTVTCRTCGTAYEAAKGSTLAAEQECTSCWGERFVRTGQS